MGTEFSDPQNPCCAIALNPEGGNLGKKGPGTAPYGKGSPYHECSVWMATYRPHWAQLLTQVQVLCPSKEGSIASQL